MFEVFPGVAAVRLTLVISSLAGGGAERVMSLLANAWARRGIDVALVTMGSASRDAYPLTPDVKRIALNLLEQSGNPITAVVRNARRVRRLRDTIRGLCPDVLVSFMPSTNVLSVLAARPLKVPVIVSERVAPEANRIAGPWRFLRKYAYRRASVVVTQTRRTADWVRKEIPGAVVEVIANPVHVESEQFPDEAAQGALAACAGHNLLLAAGRLTRQKGFDLLLHAFASLAPRLPDWRLAIFGEGPEGAALRELSQQLQIQNRVVFTGFSHALHFMMRRSQVFVLSSRFEGMPNVLAEAMSCGLPCVSFDCPTGPAELIVHERNGLLAPAEDVAGLAESLERLMRDEGLRMRLGSAAQESIGAYSTENILDHWNALLAPIVQGTYTNTRSILGD